MSSPVVMGTCRLGKSKLLLKRWFLQPMCQIMYNWILKKNGNIEQKGISWAARFGWQMSGQPMIFPFVKYSLIFNIHLYMIWHYISWIDWKKNCFKCMLIYKQTNICIGILYFELFFLWNQPVRYFSTTCRTCPSLMNVLSSARASSSSRTSAAAPWPDYLLLLGWVEAARDREKAAL